MPGPATEPKPLTTPPRPAIVAPLSAARYKIQFTADQDTHDKLRQAQARVRRDVWRRDRGQCAFVGSSGRCRELSPLEFHHVVPFGAGGAATEDNIQLRCRAHNAHEAVLYFGEEVMAGR